MADTQPSTGGAIGVKSWGYTGRSSGSGSASTGSRSGSSSESIDLSTFTIETALEDYEGTEVTTDDILALGRGPLNPNLKAVQDEAAQERERRENITAIMACGYTEEDAIRLLNGEITPEDLYNEIYQEYLAAEDPSQTRYAALLKKMVYTEGFYYDRAALTAEREELQAELDEIHSSNRDEDLAFAIKNRDACADLIAKAIFDPETNTYTYTRPDGVTVTLSEADMEEFKSSKAFWDETISSYDESKAAKVAELEEEIAAIDAQLADTSREEFPYKSEEEVDARLTEIDTRIEELKAEKAAIEEANKNKMYGYDIPSEDYTTPDGVRRILAGKKTTEYFGVKNNNIKSDRVIICQKIGDDKYVIWDATGGANQYIWLDGNSSSVPQHFTAEQLVAAGFYITESHPYDPSRLSEEEKAAPAAIDSEIAAYEAEKRKLEEKKQLIDAEYKWLLINARYTMQPDFAEKSSPDYKGYTRASTILALQWQYEGEKVDIRELSSRSGVKLEEILGAALAGMIDKKRIMFVDDDISTGELVDLQGYCLYVKDEGLSLVLQNFTDYVRAGVITDTEVQIFNYICNTEGYAAGYAYLMALYNDLDGRYLIIRQQEDAKHARSSIFAGLESLLLAPVDAIYNMRKQAIRKASGRKLQVSDSYSRAATYRATISGDIRRQYGSFMGDVFDVTYSMEQSLINTMIVIASGGNPAVAVATTAILMGTPVYNDALYSALSKGVDDDKAIAYAFSCAVIEIAMESYSTIHLAGIAGGFDKMLSSGAVQGTINKLVAHLPKGVQDYAAKLLLISYCAITQGMVEFNEEYDTEILTSLAEYIFQGDLSDSKKKFEQYKALGYTDEEALLAVACELHKDALKAGMYGFVSGSILGGATGGGASTIMTDVNNQTSEQTGSDTNTNGNETVQEIGTENTEYTGTNNNTETDTNSVGFMTPLRELTAIEVQDINARMVEMAKKKDVTSVKQLDPSTRDLRKVKVGQQGVEVITTLTDAEILKFINDFYRTSYTSLSEIDMSQGYGVPTDSRYVGVTTFADGRVEYGIIWPPADGFTQDESGNAIKTETTLKKGQCFDRYGSPDGRNISPMVQQEDGSYKPYDYEERALPYDSSQTYGQYEVMCDSLDAATIQQAVRDMPDGPDKTALLNKWSGWGIWDGDGTTGTYQGGTKTYEGTVAPWFTQPGGAGQITIPISVQDLETLGLVKKIN